MRSGSGDNDGMRWLAIPVALALCAGPSAGADVDVLFASGTVVDGTGVYTASKPRGFGKRLTFLGLTSSLVRDDGTGARTTIVATGDPLPAPLEGTFNRIVRVGGAEPGAIAFFANLNTTGTAQSGFFLVENGTITPAVLDTNPDDGGFGNRFSVNAAGDIAYFDADGLRRWQRSSGTITPIGIDGGASLRNVLIDDTAAIAWYREGRTAVGSIGYWSPGSGVVTVVMEGDVGPIGTWGDFDRRRTNIALDATHGLAFTLEAGSNGGAFLWSPPAGPLTVLAKEGDPVGTSSLVRVRNDVRIEPDGAVVFSAQVAGAGTVDVRAQNGVLTVAAPPAAGPFDVVASGSVYERRGRRVSATMKPGEVVTGLGPVASIEDYDTDGRATVVLARFEDGRLALVRRRGKTTAVVAVDGDALPFGPFAGADLRSFAVSRDTVGFVDLSGHVLLKQGDAALQWLNLAPSLGVGESWVPLAVLFQGKRTYLDGTLETIDPITFATVVKRALFEVTGGSLTPVVIEGEPAGSRKTQVFTAIASFGFAGPQLLIAGADAGGSPGIGTLRHGRATFVHTVLDPSPVGLAGPVAPVDVRVLGGGRMAFTATLTDVTGTELFPSVLTLARGIVSPLLVHGETTNLGIVDLTNSDELTTLGKTVVVGGSIPGTRSALLGRRAGR